MISHVLFHEANRVLHTFARRLDFELRERNSRVGQIIEVLYLVYEHPRTGRRSRERPVQIQRHSGSLMYYHDMGMGGTMAMAVGQLVLWIRGKPRLPLRSWEYWASDTIRLAGDNGPAMLACIAASTYGDGKATRCVLCGGDQVGDWWSLNGVTGPCCSYTRGCRQATPTP